MEWSFPIIKENIKKYKGCKENWEIITLMLHPANRSANKFDGTSKCTPKVWVGSIEGIQQWFVFN